MENCFSEGSKLATAFAESETLTKYVYKAHHRFNKLYHCGNGAQLCKKKRMHSTTWSKTADIPSQVANDGACSQHPLIN